jgi:lysophospholipase L1-like esterase
VLRKCPQDQARKIDLVLLSVGGNDIGFSRLLANAVLDNQSTLRMLGGWIGEVHGQSEESALHDHLDDKYKSLNRAIHSLLYVPWEESDRIILTGYPGMALTGDGSEICKDGRAGLEVVSDFQLSEQKLREGTWIGDKLHRQMRQSAETYGWTFVETHRRSFIDRGICSGSTQDGANPADELRLPRKIDGVWKPYNPADYAAYATRQRWFRTPNDAFMTGNFHVAASLLQKALKLDSLAWFQLLLASTYSGAFHPTAEGHAAIADAIADKARVVLEKHGQGPDPELVPDGEPPAAPPVDEPGAAVPDVSAAKPDAATPGTPNAVSTP